MIRLVALLGAAAAVALVSMPTSAAFIIDFEDSANRGKIYRQDGFTVHPFDPFAAGKKGTKCPSGDSCLRLTAGALRTSEVVFSGGIFDLLGFSVDFSSELEDKKSSKPKDTKGSKLTDKKGSKPKDKEKKRPMLTVTGERENNDGTSPSRPPYRATFESDRVVAFAGGEFAGVSKVTFTHGGTGTIHIDDIVATPLPAALPLLAAGLGGLAWMRRRRAS